MKRDNRGISLVEIIIVIAIMAVVTGTMAYGLGMISSKPAQKCAQKILYCLERHRTTAMGKMEASYTVYKKADGSIWAKEWVKTSDTDVRETDVPIGEKSVKVTYVVNGIEYDLDGSGITLKFKRGSGGFEKVGGDYCTEIVCEKAGAKYTVKLVPLTGKVYVE